MASLIIFEALIVCSDDQKIKESIQNGYQSLVAQINESEPIIQRHTLMVLRSVCKQQSEILMEYSNLSVLMESLY